MPRLSIIIPYLGSDSRLEDTLVSVLTHRPESCEIIVVHDGTYQDPYGIGDEVDLLVDEDASTFVQLLNAAMEEADAPIVHLLRPGTVVQEGWVEPALHQFDDPHVASVAPLLLHATSPEMIVSAGLKYGYGGSRRLLLAGNRLSSRKPPHARILGPTSTAGFYRLSMVTDAGLFEETLGEAAADIDLACTLRHLGYRCVFEQASRVYWNPEPSQPSAVRSGRELERLFWRQAYASGVARAIALHPLSVACSLIGLGVQRENPWSLVGRLSVLFEATRHRRYGDFVAELQHEAETLPFQTPLDSERRMAA